MIESGAIAAVAITFATYALHLVRRPGRRARAARHRAHRRAVGRQLPRRQARQPRAQRARGAQGRRAGDPDRRRDSSRAAHAGWWTRRARACRRAAASTLVAFGAAMVPILFTYGGWQNANYVGEEIANPKRNLPLALIAGTVAVVVIYVTVNVVYLRALGLDGPGGDARRRRPTRRAGCSGPSGDVFVSGAIAISTFGFLDLSILAPTRVYYAMAADRLFVPALATLHPRFGTPGLAIIVQSTWSCILALTGSYEQLANYVVFADWIFFGLTVLTVLTFRRAAAARQPRPPTPSARPATPSSRSLFVLDRRRRRGQRRRRRAGAPRPRAPC